MFVLSHLYVSRGVIGQTSDLLALGSVLPDISSLVPDKFSRGDIHESPGKIYDFIKSKYPNLVDLAIGINLHCLRSKGADYYSDDDKTGYARIEGRRIETEVARLLRIAKSHTSFILAHNFIEAGIDLNLLGSHPELITWYQKAIKTDRRPIIDCLSEYSQKDSATVEKALQTFFSILSPDNLRSTENITKNIIGKLIEIRLRITVNENQSRSILEKAKAIVHPNYLTFLDNVVQKMKSDFTELN